MHRFIAALAGHRSWTLLLLTFLSAAPIAAVGALAAYDLTGASRATPTTMGAFEVGATNRPAAPTGVTVRKL